MAVVEEAVTVLVAVVHEAVVVEAGENVDLGRPRQSDPRTKISCECDPS